MRNCEKGGTAERSIGPRHCNGVSSGPSHCVPTSEADQQSSHAPAAEPATRRRPPSGGSTSTGDRLSMASKRISKELQAGGTGSRADRAPAFIRPVAGAADCYAVASAVV